MTENLSIIIACNSDGFNRVQTKRPHQALLKYIKKCPPLHEKLLYFFIVAPGRRWNVKKKRKNFEDYAPSAVVTCACENVKIQIFFRDHNLLRENKVPVHALNHPMMVP